jgi:hypothetical protein
MLLDFHEAYERLNRRWQEELALLHAHADSAPSITVESTRGRLRKLYEDAQLIGVLLPKPSFQDAAFEGMDFSRDVAQEVINFATEEAKREEQRRKSREASRKRWDRIAEELGHTRRKHRPHTGPNYCLCGCGGKCRMSFLPGHHTRWYGDMRRIERREMPRECLNETLKAKLRWTKCMHCGGFIPTTDPWGRPIAKRLGYECQRRARALERRGATETEIYKLLKGKAVA